MIVENRARTDKFYTTFTRYFDELYIKVDGTNDKVEKINTNADQIKTAINETIEKVDIWHTLTATVLSRIERKIDRIGTLSETWKVQKPKAR